MEKIDRLGWAAGISLVSYGVRVGVRTNRPEVLDDVVERLPPGWKHAESPIVDRLYSFLVGGRGARPGIRRYNLLYADSSQVARTINAAEVLDTLESEIQMYVAEFAKRRVFVHAGVVGWKGRAILMPGRSFTGKSRLVKGLVSAGAQYYSDEYAVLDSLGRVHPFPRPLGLRNAPATMPKKVPVEALGGSVGVKPLLPALVIVSKYKPEARWRPRMLSPGKGLLELLSNTVPARSRPEASLTALRQVVSQAPVLQGVRGEVTQTVDSILKFLDG